MHICFLTNEFPKKGFPHGGIGSFVKTTATEFVKLNIKVSVIGINYSNNNEFLIENGIEIHRLKPTQIPGFSWFFNSIVINKTIKKVHKNHPILIIETSELGLAFINKIQSIKYIIRLHGGHHFFAESEKRGINIWKGFQEKLSFKKADAFIAVSIYVKTHTEKYLSFNNKKVELIKNPINTILFEPLNLPIIENRIVFAGTVCEKKGIRQLIQAFGIVKNKFPKSTLEIYGRDWFFKNGKSYIEMLKNVELPKLNHFAKDINFHGAVDYDNIPNKYAEAEVCVFPSHMETQGLVAPEAMAMEKNVIFTELGPGPETIINFETGLLCNPFDINDIANKIMWVFNNNEKSISMGQKARESVLKNYSLDKIVQQNLDFYRNILNN
jgi:glycosyltransferase involved in cell wall biosynthesis